MAETRADAATRADGAEARAKASEARAVASDARADASDLRADNLEIALGSRDVIGMAKGILMHAENVGPEEAFEILVRSSQNQNRKLHDFAAELVAKYPAP